MDPFIETLAVYNTVSQHLTESVFFNVIPALIFLYTLIIKKTKNNTENNKNKTKTKHEQQKVTQENLLWKLSVNLKKKQKEFF